MFDDANLDQALDQLMALKWRHAGQACITANRVYVQAGIYDKFAQMLKERTEKLVVGHGAQEGTTMGPLTTPRGLDKAREQVEDARRLGADVILGGGQVPGQKGYFFQPTILTGMKEEMLVRARRHLHPLQRCTGLRRRRRPCAWPTIQAWAWPATRLPRILTVCGGCWRILRRA